MDETVCVDRNRIDRLSNQLRTASSPAQPREAIPERSLVNLILAYSRSACDTLSRYLFRPLNTMWTEMPRSQRKTFLTS